MAVYYSNFSFSWLKALHKRYSAYLPRSHGTKEPCVIRSVVVVQALVINDTLLVDLSPPFFSKQATKVIQYIHGKKVSQTDTGTHNLLLDKRDKLQLGDFASSSVDDEPSCLAPSGHEGSHLFASKSIEPSAHTELYSLGCVFLRFREVGNPITARQTKEIEELHDAGRFPDTDNLILGTVIQKCWTFQYDSASEVLNEIDKVMEEHLPSTENGCMQMATKTDV
ncbi:uncharacterized protein A1O5_12009 [Cladophialophora psammophila CBS 110553]|uniref:Protein kinase domain-containing protein n=1 Tax=Cladophialophora psammophila CBS 110553 TaxID=1182543 RepID=W9VZF3_9EURO|nr:uncharacterized protein A1O5_12009 [Cladophialophora psammophila CBS 110553]EXJ61217.1 hypothetical protein A1O5_12009 [Cladophialophora psammophila CBS 110553]